ncbi:MAG: hypothetical protein KAS66_05250 [Candidatus Omnitrophica bacterium]|nr:hypothetical protein [Candidatus Omnitrophota bacterium]
MIEAKLIDGLTGDALHTHDPYGHGSMLAVTNFHEAHGSFKATQSTSAQTITLTEPSVGGALAISSLLISARKSQGNSITIRFTDETNTEVVFAQLLTNLDVSVPIAITHGWRGWKDARLELTTTGTDQVNITVGYSKLERGVPFDAWDAMR